LNLLCLLDPFGLFRPFVQLDLVGQYLLVILLDPFVLWGLWDLLRPFGLLRPFDRFVRLGLYYQLHLLRRYYLFDL
jgi:hypothetical protein